MSDRLPHEKGFHVSWDQIHRDSRALAWRLDGHGPDNGAWKAVVAITRGGMAPATIVSRELDIRTVDTISIKSYDHQTQSEPRIIKTPDMDVVGDGTGVLIVDDLVDTGKTLEVVRKHMPNDGSVIFTNSTLDVTTLGLWGPNAPAVLGQLTSQDLYPDVDAVIWEHAVKE